jgi:hypothetical protein
MDNLHSQELIMLLRFYSNCGTSRENAERILEIAKALHALLKDPK